MSERTLQQIYTTSRNHLLTQLERSTAVIRSTTSVPMCAYRGDRGLKCAVGILIPDSLYESNLEGKSVCALEVAHAAGLSSGSSSTLAGGDQVFLALKLQSIHDAYPVERWEELLNKLPGEHPHLGLVVELTGPLT